MRILHYALGFPPYRTGGLTKFCIDLMLQQEKEGHETAMLWPGQMGFVVGKVLIRERNETVLAGAKIKSFEIINPLPVPYDEGIQDFKAFTADGGEAAYGRFLNVYRPDVIHVHTLMGLHKNLLILARHRGIRLVYTAHDFFPICPKVTLFRNGKICGSLKTCKECSTCNTTALGINKIRLLQSKAYRMLKDTKAVKKLRKKHRDIYLGEIAADKGKAVGTAEEYRGLRMYYKDVLNLMDIIHYNSSITKNVFEQVFGTKNNCVVGITHGDIKNHKKIKPFLEDKLRIRYLGPQGGAKGYFLLKSALDEVWRDEQNFRLDIHFVPREMSPYMNIHDRYTYDDLEEIFDETDILVVPSIWYETFGFTVLEALSYGVPVLVSGTVGAKDILADGAGVVIENMDTDKLHNEICELTADKLRQMNKTIVSSQTIMSIEQMAQALEKQCYQIRL